MKKIAFYILFITPLFSIGQDIHFSQTTRANYQINPAFTACFNGDIKVEMNWKNQWRSVDKSFRTYGTSFEYAFNKRSFKPKNVFFGVEGHVFRDVTGAIQLGNTNAGASFSTLVKVNRNAHLSMGMQANFNSVGINPAKLEWSQQYSGLNFDPSLSNGEGIDFKPFNYTDLSFGLAYWYHKKDRGVFGYSPSNAKIGFAAYHVTKPDFNFGIQNFKLPMRFVLHGDATFIIHEHVYWKPNINIMYQNKQHEVLIGSLWKYTIKNGSKQTGFSTEWYASAGVDFRITNIFDAIIPQLFIGAENFSFGISYDINVSRASVATQNKGGFEFSLRFINPDNKYHKNPLKPSSSI